MTPQPRAFPGPGTTVGEKHTLPDGRVMIWDGSSWHQEEAQESQPVHVATTAPNPPAEGMLWYDMTHFRLNVRLASAWIQA
jgi:hypothetical protein